MRTVEERVEGYELERLMAERDLTQRELAERAGVEDSVVSLACKGEQSMSVESERKVARALGVEVSEPVEEGGVEG